MLSRRTILAATGLAAAAAPMLANASEDTLGVLTPPADRPLRVAFLIGRVANAGDVGETWNVFMSTVLGYDASDAETMSMADHRIGFELYTVSDTDQLVAFGGDMKVSPNYTVENAPMPDILVVPTHVGNEVTNAWMRTAAAQAQVVMGVCTGAFNLAEAGLIDGVRVRTHHHAYTMFQQQAPRAILVRRKGFMFDGKIATTSSATYGAQLALNLVKRYYGRERAEIVADYLEIEGRAWNA